MSIQDISNIFSNNCNYNVINKNHHNMRNIPNGISVLNALIYRMQYTFLNPTKQSVASDLNLRNKVGFTRQAYDAKENNK